MQYFTTYVIYENKHLEIPRELFGLIIMKKLFKIINILLSCSSRHVEQLPAWVAYMWQKKRQPRGRHNLESAQVPQTELGWTSPCSYVNRYLFPKRSSLPYFNGLLIILKGYLQNPIDCATHLWIHWYVTEEEPT